MNNVALIGCGYWGKNYVNSLRDSEKVDLKYICDPIPSKGLPAQLLKEKGIDYYSKILDKVDSVIIATPTKMHYNIAKDCLNHGKHVLVEKPITDDVSDAEELIKIAEKEKVVLMVGHIFKYNPAVIQLKKIIESGELGSLRYLEAKRVGLGPIRKDVSALWDLATHDIYVSNFLIGNSPISVSYQGVSHNKIVDDIVSLNLKYPNNILTTIYVNWEHPIKERKFVVGGTKKAVLFDDVQPTEKLFIYNKGVDYQPISGEFGDFQAATRDGDILIPKIQSKQPLLEELNHFFNCINGSEQCRSDGRDGLEIVKILSAAEESKKRNGLEVILR
ncbi:MAG: Gfo/Idh/MocA family oxidoreductase [Candidatus Nanoarchaeia archaeon]